MNLLQAYILQEVPHAHVYIQFSWPKDVPQTRGGLAERLREMDPELNPQNVPVILLFDEGQDSYGDAYLWNYFFKGIGDRLFSNYYAVIFCSYGSPTSRIGPCFVGTPPVLREAARISLWPTERSIGLLLDRSEFQEVVALFDRPLRLHPDFEDRIFNWTAGHVGAIVELLRMISYQVSLLWRCLSFFLS